MSHLVEIQARNIKKFNYMRLGNYHDKYGKLVCKELIGFIFIKLT